MLNSPFIMLTYINLIGLVERMPNRERKNKGVIITAKKSGIDKKKLGIGKGGSSSSSSAMKKQGTRDQEEEKTKEWKKLDPVTAAYIKVIRTSKQIKQLRSTMSPIVLKEMMIGLNGMHKEYKSHEAYLFAGQIGMTHCTEKKKITKADGRSPDIKKLIYDLNLSTYKNQHDLYGFFVPDYMGKKMTKPEDSTTIKASFNYECDDESSTLFHDSIKGMVNCDMSDEHAHKFLSIVFRGGKFDKHIRAALLGKMNAYEREIRKSIISELKTITSERSNFKHENESYDSISTSDYVIHVCGTRHFVNGSSYGIEVRKKIIIAELKNSTDQLSNGKKMMIHIPICEEISIQIKIPDQSNTKGVPNLVNSENRFVISSALSLDAQSVFDINLHYFGDNAFSVGYKMKNTLMDQPHDKTKICARFAGHLIKNIYDINSTDYYKAASSVSYFKSMFKAQNYTKFDSGVPGDVMMKELLTLKASAERPQGGSFESDGIQRVSDDQINHIKLKNSELSNEDISGVLNSFLKRQNVRGLLEINAGRGCNIEKWISSQAFSMLSISSQKYPHKKYVFISTFIHGREIKNVSSPSALLGRGRHNQPRSEFETSSSLHVDWNDRPVPTTTKMNSMLSPDLERELEIILN